MGEVVILNRMVREGITELRTSTQETEEVREAPHRHLGKSSLGSKNSRSKEPWVEMPWFVCQAQQGGQCSQR
jgi:hypothetical protein